MACYMFNVNDPITSNRDLDLPNGPRIPAGSDGIILRKHDLIPHEHRIDVRFRQYGIVEGLPPEAFDTQPEAKA